MIQNPELDEDSSPEWEAIKNYVGGANKQTKHPIQMEQERIQRRKPQHMDEGGVAGFSDDLLKLSQPPGSGIIAPGLGQPTTQPPIQALPQPAIATVAPPAATPPPVSAPAQPPAIPGPADAGYDAQASKIMGGVTPETIQRLSESLNKPNWRQGIGLGLTGMADALSRAGGSNSDYERQYGERMQQGKEMQMKVPEAMAAAGKEKYGLSQTMQNKDPQSPYSKIAQQTYGPDLVKMGLTKDQVAKMPADLIGDLMSKKVTLTEALARIQETGEFHEDMVQNTRAGLANTAANQKAERTQGAAKALAGQGFFKSLTDMIPGTSGHTAHQTLEKEAAGGGGGNFTPDVTAYAEKHGITPEQAQAQKDRRTQGQ